MKFVTRAVPLAFLLTPVLAFAQFGAIDVFFYRILLFINNILVPLVFAIAFLIFIWGIFRYFIMGGANPEEQKKGRQLMLYGIAGFIIMVTIWGIVNLLARGLGLSGTQNIRNIPNTPTIRTTIPSGSGSGSGTQFPSGSSGSGSSSSGGSSGSGSSGLGGSVINI